MKKNTGEQVILVDEQDKEVGQEEKMTAHKNALCHRAFSVFVLRKNSKGNVETLLQKRQLNKYHCGGLWTNTCCSHPRLQEDVIVAGHRRLKEEMGFDLDLKEVGVFHYIAKFDNGLTENEIDHVLVGFYDGQSIKINSDEVAEYKWIELTELKKDLQKHSEKYTPWFELALNHLGVNV